MMQVNGLDNDETDENCAGNFRTEDIGSGGRFRCFSDGGALHKLTLALRRLDPDNSRWEQLQQDRAGQAGVRRAFKISNHDQDTPMSKLA